MFRLQTREAMQTEVGYKYFGRNLQTFDPKAVQSLAKYMPKKNTLKIYKKDSSNKLLMLPGWSTELFQDNSQMKESF